MAPDGPPPDQRVEPTASVARWLLTRGAAKEGVGLTKTLALRRTVVREAAERWPEWWDHERFGPPYREAELPVLEETHAGLRRLRLMRRRRETLHTSKRGRELLADPEALVRVLRSDLVSADPFDAAAWPPVERALLAEDALETGGVMQGLRPVLDLSGWRTEDGAPFDDFSLWQALVPLLARAEGYGLLERRAEPRPLRLALTSTGRAHAGAAPNPARMPPGPGDAALVLTVPEKCSYPRVLEVRGTPPPQYPALDER